MPADLIELIKSKLLPLDINDESHYASDYDLNPDVELPNKKPKKAAVLIPIVKRNDEIMVILTRRSLELKVHSGQIAFPGGRFDEGDENLVQTALREAHEEIGLAPDMVKPIARAENYLSATNYLITPIIGLVNENAKFNANKDEVDEIFEIPFEFLFNKHNHELRSYFFGGKDRQFYAITYHKYFIWGVSAGLIAAITEKLVL